VRLLRAYPLQNVFPALFVDLHLPGTRQGEERHRKTHMLACTQAVMQLVGLLEHFEADVVLLIEWQRFQLDGNGQLRNGVIEQSESARGGRRNQLVITAIWSESVCPLRDRAYEKENMTKFCSLMKFSFKV
jgi:hypothetical protein